ncbi:DUF4330 family protein [Halorientalis salina]|uniref:DUF4330 family protein n=1 Tax=Halorientalis salina TaxID=2932266 RepID=UPI0010AC952B|nr:DUF4330 family protein [Halorientalis salina]
MVALIDEDGRLFGLVNIVDLLVVLVVVAMVAAGWALVAGGAEPQTNETENTTTVVTIEAQQLEPYVAEAVPNGSVGGQEVVAVHSKTVEPTTVFVPDRNGQLRVREHPRLKTATLRVELNTTRTAHGLNFTGERKTTRGFVEQDRPLRIGQRLRLDIGDTTLAGNVTAIEN